MNSFKIIVKNNSEKIITINNNKLRPNTLSELYVTEKTYKELKENADLEVFTFTSHEFVEENLNKIKELLNEVNNKVKLIEEYIPEYKETR